MLAWCLASRLAILGLLISEKSRPPGKYVNGFFSFPMEPAIADGTCCWSIPPACLPYTAPPLSRGSSVELIGVVCHFRTELHARARLHVARKDLESVSVCPGSSERHFAQGWAWGGPREGGLVRLAVSVKTAYELLSTLAFNWPETSERSVQIIPGFPEFGEFQKNLIIGALVHRRLLLIS